ncbi:MarR family transcriptional regulator [Actinomadura rubrobrunea]|uniref:MarR family transcriptional regulator n=1 Tax=Actinomadura rubrobrunea TaxID=115335 RepID=A0A9W6UV90_9ACTN|nr:MarR family transcriptional regulator [Actinomadura rubrobrunea]GLW64774.1 MarR family transcriptional regulator [Actinomadura rubrobrunea]
MSPDDGTLEDALVRMSFRVTTVLTRVAAEHDLSLTQLRLLGFLRDRRARMTDLAALLGLDKSTLSGLVERAERRGLVARGRSPEDRRVVDVSLTEQGRELAERLLEEVRVALAPSTERLQEDDRRLLTHLLDTVAGRAPIPLDDQQPTTTP